MYSEPSVLCVVDSTPYISSFTVRFHRLCTELAHIDSCCMKPAGRTSFKSFSEKGFVKCDIRYDGGLKTKGGLIFSQLRRCQSVSSENLHNTDCHELLNEEGRLTPRTMFFFLDLPTLVWCTWSTKARIDHDKADLNSVDCGFDRLLSFHQLFTKIASCRRQTRGSERSASVSEESQ